jgi:hypothetical protein
MKKLKLTTAELTQLSIFIGKGDPLSVTAGVAAAHKKIKAHLASKAEPTKSTKPKPLKEKDMKKLFREIKPKTAVFTKGEFLDKVVANIAAVNGAAKN